MKGSEFYYKNNRLQKIRGFYHVVTQGSFTKAAKVMGVTQPAVSLQINALEQELNINLFTSKAPSIILSPEGINFYEKCVPILKAMDILFEEGLLLKEDTYANTLCVGANNATLNYILPYALKHYFDEMPSMKSFVYHSHREEGLKLLREGKIDIFLTPPWNELNLYPEFEYTPFVNFIPSLITLPSHPLAGKRNITIQQIAQYNLTLCPANYFTIPGLNTFFQRYGIQPTLKVEFIDWESPRRYIETGISISIANNIMLNSNDTIVATPLLHYFPINDYGYVLMRGHGSSAKLTPLINILKRLYPNGICTNGLTIPLEELKEYNIFT